MRILAPDEAGRILTDSSARIWNRLLRHRERYLRAFMAATGLHPTECEIQETHDPIGDVIRMRVVPAEQGVNVVAYQKARILELDDCAKGLWGLLDDIDTLGDSMKPEQNAYFKAVQKILEKRLRFGSSDGYIVIVARRP